MCLQLNPTWQEQLPRRVEFKYFILTSYFILWDEDATCAVILFEGSNCMDDKLNCNFDALSFVTLSKLFV